MSSPETQFDTFIKFQFLAIGLWPYQQSEFTRFQFILFSVILLTFIIFQLTPLITLKRTSNLITKVLSSASFFSLFTTKYISFRFNIEVVKDLLMQLQHTHNEIKDENEIAIVERYKCIAKRYTNSLTVVAICGVLVSLIMEIWLNIADANLSTNMTRFPIMEYFIDQEKSFYLILFHVTIATYVGTAAMLTIGSTLITYFLHTCGMFKIASYRIENAMNVKILQNITMEGSIFMYDGIICAVNIHRQALKLSKNLQSAVQVMIFCLVVCGVTSLSLNLYQIASFKNDVQELLLSSLFVFVIVLYMFIANYIGQKALEHNNHIFATAYNVQWYKAPLHVQKMILFLLQKGVKEHTLNLGGLLHGSMECFATLLKTSVSYFTVIHSMQ